MKAGKRRTEMANECLSSKRSWVGSSRERVQVGATVAPMGVAEI